MTRFHTILTLLLIVFPAMVHGQKPGKDLILRHGKIWTVDRALPEAEAVVLRNGRILAVGADSMAMSFVASAERVIDLGGRRVLPGFIDDHAHFMDGGFQLQNVDLRDAASIDEFARRIRDRALAQPSRWITGGDWDHDNWPGGPLPTKESIDRWTRSTPVFVSRYDGHMALANSLVLSLAGITRDTPDPPGGTIVRDPRSGEPTGILKDEAMSAVYRIIPDRSDTERREAALRALAEARRFGVTSIQDISSPADVSLYRELAAEGLLTARMYCRQPIGYAEALAARHDSVGSGDEWVRTGSLKAFADGSLGSSTALFCQPYLSDPSTHGLPSDILLDGRLEQWAVAADRAHMQLSVHAIGDSANGLILDLFERIVRTNPPWDRRFRIEHAQHIRPGDFARFGRLGVIASAQAYHAIDDGRWAEGRIGHERCRTTYAFRTFLDHGVRLAFGSDWTVAPLNPLTGISAAVTRRTTDGKNPNGWFPEQKLQATEAIDAYTMTNAYAAFEENVKGSITPGKFADVVVLSDDILSVDPGAIADVSVVMTIVGGTIVYERKE